MPRSLWRLTVRSEFSSGHALRHFKGKCESLHGHNFSVEATIEGETLQQNVEFLVDFGILKKILKEILEELDHKNINELIPFTTLNPTSENLSRYIYQRFSPRVLEHGVRLYSVTVGENSVQCATYMEMP